MVSWGLVLHYDKAAVHSGPITSDYLYTTFPPDPLIYATSSLVMKHKQMQSQGYRTMDVGKAVEL